MPILRHGIARPDDNARRALGYVGLVLSGASLGCIGFGLPWQVRFPIVIMALLLGPAVPLMLLHSKLPALESVVAGIGVDIALVMLVAEVMVLVHIWWPEIAVGALLVLSVAASGRLLVTSVHREEVRSA